MTSRLLTSSTPRVTDTPHSFTLPPQLFLAHSEPCGQSPVLFRICSTWISTGMRDRRDHDFIAIAIVGSELDVAALSVGIILSVYETKQHRRPPKRKRLTQ